MNRLFAALLLGSYIFLAVNYLWPPHVARPLSSSDDPKLHLFHPLHHHEHPIVAAAASTGRSPAVAAVELPPASLFHPTARAPPGAGTPNCVHDWYAPVCCAFAPDTAGSGAGTPVTIVNACLCAMASGVVTAHGECPSVSSSVASTTEMTITPTPPPPHAIFDAAADADVAVHADAAFRRWLPGSSAPCPRVYAPVCCMYNGDPGITASMANSCLCELGRGKIKSQGDCPDPAASDNIVTNTAAPTAERKLPAFGGACPHVYAPVCCMYNNDPSTTASMPNACVCALGRGKVKSQGDCPSVVPETVTNTAAPTAERKLPAFGGACPRVYAPVCCMYNGDPGITASIANACLCKLGRGKIKSQGDCPDPAAPDNTVTKTAALTSERKLPAKFGGACPHVYAPVCCMYNDDPGVVANISNACVCALGRGKVKSEGDCPTSHSTTSTTMMPSPVALPSPAERQPWTPGIGRNCPHTYAPVCCMYNDDAAVVANINNACICELGRGRVKSHGDCPAPEQQQRATRRADDEQAVQRLLPGVGRHCPRIYAPVCCMYNGDPSVVASISSACVCELGRGTVKSQGDCPTTAAESVPQPPRRPMQAASADNLWTDRTTTRSRTWTSGSSVSKSAADLPLTPQMPPTAVKLPSDMVNAFGRRCTQDWAPVCCMFNGDPDVRFTMHNACACEIVRGAVIASTACVDGKTDKKKHGSKKRSKSACHTIKGCLNKMFS